MKFVNGCWVLVSAYSVMRKVYSVGYASKVDTFGFVGTLNPRNRVVLNS